MAFPARYLPVRCDWWGTDPYHCCPALRHQPLRGFVFLSGRGRMVEPRWTRCGSLKNTCRVPSIAKCALSIPGAAWTLISNKGIYSICLKWPWPDGVAHLASARHNAFMTFISSWTNIYRLRAANQLRFARRDWAKLKAKWTGIWVLKNYVGFHGVAARAQRNFMDLYSGQHHLLRSVAGAG